MKHAKWIAIPLMAFLAFVSCSKSESNNPTPNPSGSALSATISGTHSANITSTTAILGYDDSTGDYASVCMVSNGTDSITFELFLHQTGSGHTGTFPIMSSSDLDPSLEQAWCMIIYKSPLGTTYYDGVTGSGSLVVTSTGTKWAGTFQFNAVDMTGGASTLSIASGAFNMTCINVNH